MSIPVRTKSCPFPWWTWFGVVNLLPGGWLITVGKDAISRAKCLFLLLADWALIIGHRHISLVWMSMLLGPCIISIPATMATLLMSPLGDDRGGWGKGLTGIYRTSHSNLSIVKILLCWGHPLVNICMEHRCLHIFHQFREVYPRISSPDFLVTSFSIMFLLSPWPSSQTISHNPWISI